jgi:serine protease Do
MGLSVALPFASSFAQQQPAANQNAAAPNITQQVQTQTQAPMQSLSPIVDRVQPAVVNISVTMKGTPAVAESDSDSDDQFGPGIQPGFPPSPFDELLRRFFEQQGIPNGGGNGGPFGQRSPIPRGAQPKAVALGSGFIIDPSGYVVTNNHVVGQADSVTVIFQDDSKHPAKIVGRDPKTDIALLKIDAKKPLPYVQWGDSDHTKVGDWIIAVGNPFGLGGTVTTGIVSARGRDIRSGPFDDFLQLDAPINRGNSGGPTFDMQGRVIGINTAIYSPNGGSVGIGFAIPSNLAKNIVDQLKQQGHVTRGWLGVQIQNVTPEIAKTLGLDPNAPKGALVAAVQDNSPAQKAGVKQGDVITTVNGHEIDKVHDLPRLVAETPVGKTLDITVMRNGKRQQVEATIAELKDQDRQFASSKGGSESQQKAENSAALGLQFAPLDAQIRRRLHIGKDVKGVVVAGVVEDSPAAAVGLMPGDVIESVNQQPVTSPGEAAAKLKEAAKQKQILLLLNRRGTNEFVGLSVEDGGNQG